MWERSNSLRTHGAPWRGCRHTERCRVHQEEQQFKEFRQTQPAETRELPLQDKLRQHHHRSVNKLQSKEPFTGLQGFHVTAPSGGHISAVVLASC